MTLHPSVIEAAELTDENWGFPERRARRVLLAQARPEAISDGMVDEALDNWYPGEDWKIVFGCGLLERRRAEMRAAISAALLHIAGGE